MPAALAVAGRVEHVDPAVLSARPRGRRRSVTLRPRWAWLRAWASGVAEMGARCPRPSSVGVVEVQRRRQSRRSRRLLDEVAALLACAGTSSWRRRGAAGARATRSSRPGVGARKQARSAPRRVSASSAYASLAGACSRSRPRARAPRPREDLLALLDPHRARTGRGTEQHQRRGSAGRPGSSARRRRAARGRSRSRRSGPGPGRRSAPRDPQGREIEQAQGGGRARRHLLEARRGRRGLGAGDALGQARCGVEARRGRRGPTSGDRPRPAGRSPGGSSPGTALMRSSACDRARRPTGTRRSGPGGTGRRDGSATVRRGASPPSLARLVPGPSSPPARSRRAGWGIDVERPCADAQEVALGGDPAGRRSTARASPSSSTRQAPARSVGPGDRSAGDQTPVGDLLRFAHRPAGARADGAARPRHAAREHLDLGAGAPAPTGDRRAAALGGRGRCSRKSSWARGISVAGRFGQLGPRPARWSTEVVNRTTRPRT